MKIIIGAGETHFEGWHSTQESELNVLNLEDWERLVDVETVDAILAEHVWEHMTYEEGLLAALNCYKVLKPGGYIRCAVPDRNFNNEWYQNMVQVGGPGPQNHPTATHKVVYDCDRLVSLFEQAGFVVTPLEYCDKNGDFHYHYWNEADGKIGRSYRFDSRNSRTCLHMVSVIIDAKKPLTIRHRSNE